MNWIDVASIVFVCVTANHLGLISKIEEVTGRELPVINCPKCSTFWVTMGWGCNDIASYGTLIAVLAISFLASYTAIWLELLEGLIDTLYMKIYGKVITTGNDDTAAADADNGHSTGTVPEL